MESYDYVLRFVRLVQINAVRLYIVIVKNVLPLAVDVQRLAV